MSRCWSFSTRTLLAGYQVELVFCELRIVVRVAKTNFLAKSIQTIARSMPQI